jgi:hypothetical protein
MKKFTILLVFVASLSLAQQEAAPVQLTPLPPKPTCVIILRNGACADLWRNYNQAVAQRVGEQIKLYVNRQSQLASSQATAPLLEHIADLTKLTTDEQAQIKTLQEQMQSESVAALQAKTDAHTEGLQKGAALGAGGILLLAGLVFGIKKLTQDFTVTKKEHAKAAAA